MKHPHKKKSQNKNPLLNIKTTKRKENMTILMAGIKMGQFTAVKAVGDDVKGCEHRMTEP